MPSECGINVIGYGVLEHGRHDIKGMQTCGQIEIGNFTAWSPKEGETPETFIGVLRKKYGYAASLNIIFSVTSNAISVDTYNKPKGLLKWLLEHANTRVMYWYRNDAHGPNWIFMCIYHHNKKADEFYSPGYRVSDLRIRHRRDHVNGSFIMEKE